MILLSEMDAMAEMSDLRSEGEAEMDGRWRRKRRSQELKVAMFGDKA